MSNPENIDNDNESIESLLEKKRRIEQEEKELQEEIDNHLQNVRNNLQIFIVWAKNTHSREDFYKKFVEEFDDNYRSQLFENVCEFFNDDTFVSDECVFYWKSIVVNLLTTNKKYSQKLVELKENSGKELKTDLKLMTTNLRLVKQKYIFKCFVEDEPVCFFKENGVNYYLS